MLPEKRRALIMEMLHETKSIKNSDISTRFGVNSLTVRRDLDMLQQQGLIRRVYGGALLCEDAALQPGAPDKDSQEDGFDILQGKVSAIAKEAAKLVREGDILFLGNGVIVEEISKRLRRFSHLTIVTSSLPVVNQMINTPNAVYVLGGKLHHDEQNFSGNHAMAMLKDFRADKAFINGFFSVKHGVMSNFIPAAELGKLMIQNADVSVLVCGSGEMDQTGLYSVCPLSDLNLIIVDESLTPAQRKALEETGQNIKFVASGNEDEVSDLAARCS